MRKILQVPEMCPGCHLLDQLDPQDRRPVRRALDAVHLIPAWGMLAERDCGAKREDGAAVEVGRGTDRGGR